jgi:5-hydroxyisourate hydrolase-like protein (transthyretin family)
MKYLLSFLLLASVVLAAWVPSQAPAPAAPQGIAGTIFKNNTDQPAAGVEVNIFQDKKNVATQKTDEKGRYEVPRLDIGVYDAEVALAGYGGHRILRITVLAAQMTTLDLVLLPDVVGDELEVAAWSPRLHTQVAKDKLGAGVEGEDDVALDDAVPAGSVRERRAVPLSTPSTTAPVPPASEPAPASDEVIVLSETVVVGAKPRVKKSVSTMTAKPVESKAKMAKADSRKASAEPIPTKPTDVPKPGVPGTPDQPTPRAGLLTAGEWNDLHNWAKHWTDLLSDGEITPFQNQYQFFPRHRYAVLLHNQQGVPVIDVTVQLLDNEDVVQWEARTDNTGKAELWYALGAEKKDAPRLQLRAVVDGKTHDLGTARPYAEGIGQYQIERTCTMPHKVDIVWAVDATGSMGDEIEYLKTELLDVIGRVKNANPDLTVRMGTVFYRDQEDEYLVRSSGLSNDVGKTVQFIRQQSAGGGGDYPEAVETALESAIFDQKWSADAVSRICFLVLDASPHQSPQVNESMQRSIREAARRGIRVVPIAASGIQKDTEFLMKFFGLATNGSYVFLTDHSGIGGKHLAPTTDEYKVELLNDLLVRLITEYTSVETCEGKTAIRFDTTQDPQQQPGNTLPPAFFYPNPATTHVTLELPFDAQKVTLYDAEGRAVRDLTQPATGTHRIAVQDLPAGFYTLRIWKGEQVQSGKVLVVKP